MVSKYKNRILTDWKHWLGWLITTGSIIGIFHLLKVHGLHTPWYHVLILFSIVIIVDFIKHKIKLQ